MASRDTEKAFKWIVSLLQKQDVQFQIVGGLAARAYGATRELVDIDFFITPDGFEQILPEVKYNTILGPGRYIDAQWDLRILTLLYEGQVIDLGDAAGTKIFNAKTKQWEQYGDFAYSEIKQLYGIKVPVITKERLIAYKNKLAREVDIIDMAQMTGV